MIKRGWMRLWAFGSAVLLLASLSFGFIHIWGADACYRYVTISTSPEKATKDDLKQVASLRHEVATKTYCGKNQFSALITIEHLAKKGVVTQIAFQWREPRGWVYTEFDQIDILNGQQIASGEILSRVEKYVRDARALSLVPYAIGIAVFSLSILVFGIGVAWVRAGFKGERE